LSPDPLMTLNCARTQWIWGQAVKPALSPDPITVIILSTD
jgi:hypothetical protein